MYRFNDSFISKADSMRSAGAELYPAGTDQKFTPIFSLVHRFKDYTLEQFDESMIHTIAGRIRFKNDIGKIGFIRIQDSNDKIQVMIRKNLLSESDFKIWKRFDVGDNIIVSGYMSRTQTGELSLFATSVSLASKCLEGMPDKVSGLTDPELRRRQRYLDMIVNPEVRKVFEFRSELVRRLRIYLSDLGFMEVETPILQAIPGGANARPFVTHHNALDADFYLRIAPELYLKTLLVGGFERVFEIGKNFRNEGFSPKHNPEFTSVEFYATHHTYTWSMEVVEEFFQYLELTQYTYPFRRVRYDELISSLGINNPWNPDELRAFWLSKNPDSQNMPDSVGHWFELLFDTYIEDTLQEPTFVTHFPTEISPLARKNDQEPQVTDRFELYLNGQEIANGFNELNDPQDQAARFEEQAKAKSSGDDEAMFFDEEYIRALSYGMPPAVGCGIGIDRLVAILTKTENIRDVILFPTMKR